MVVVVFVIVELGKVEMEKEEYLRELQDIQSDLMGLGEWWRGREGEVFGLE